MIQRFLKTLAITFCCFVAALSSKTQCMNDIELVKDKRHTSKGPKAARRLLNNGNPNDRKTIIDEVAKGNKNAISGAKIEIVADSGNPAALDQMITRKLSVSE